MQIWLHNVRRKSFLPCKYPTQVFSGAVFTHQYVYIGSITRIDVGLLTGKDEDAVCDVARHETYRSVPGAVAWIVRTRAELAVYLQALQRRAHEPRIKDCKMLNIVIGYMKRHKCGLKSVTLSHPLKLVASIDATFKAQPEEPTGFALRGVAAVLCGDRGNSSKPHGDNGKADLIDFTLRRQRGVVRSTFCAELNGLVDSNEQMLLLECTLHQIYCGTAQSPERMIDHLERG